MLTSKLESKNCKQGTAYARPSPAIAGISGISFKLPLALWILSLHTKKIGHLHCPQHIRQLQIFFQRDSMHPVDESIEFRLSITPAYFIQVGITMYGSIVAVLAEITTHE